MLLSPELTNHSSSMVRAAGAAVLGELPVGAWQMLPPQTCQTVLLCVATAAGGDPAPAVRASACKSLGCLLLLPPGPILQQSSSSGGADDLQPLLAPLVEGVSAAAASVRQSAAWAIAAVCGVVHAPHLASGGDAAGGGGGSTPALAPAPAPAQGVAPDVLRMLCDAALTAAGDGDKVRVHGVRAVGVLLAVWHPSWGLVAATGVTGAGAAAQQFNNSSSSSVGSGSNKPMEQLDDAWAWVPHALTTAMAALQSCLAARSMKCVWNAACAAAGVLANAALLKAPEVRQQQAGGGTRERGGGGYRGGRSRWRGEGGGEGGVPQGTYVHCRPAHVHVRHAAVLYSHTNQASIAPYCCVCCRRCRRPCRGCCSCCVC